jgi:hypothetical protein
MVVQALEYEKRDNIDLSAFFYSYENYFKHEIISEWARIQIRRLYLISKSNS